MTPPPVWTAFMPRIWMILSLCLTLVAAPVSAACYADYKAKQDGPLRLHYGVIELDDSLCGDRSRAAAEISRRIAGDGWQLLSVVGILDADAAERKRADCRTVFPSLLKTAVPLARAVAVGIAAIVAILLVAAVFLFLNLPDANAFDARVERIFIENTGLTSGEDIQLFANPGAIGHRLCGGAGKLPGS